MSKPGEWWDLSWNFGEGCTPISEACENCWAMVYLRRFRKGQKPGDVRFYDHRSNTKTSPLIRNKPTRYFVGSLTDPFHDAYSDEKLKWVFRHLTLFGGRKHTHCLLTKRPRRAAEFLESAHTMGTPYNLIDYPFLWVGITAENQARFDERMIDFWNVEAAVKFVSFEPLLGPVIIPEPILEGIDWIIVGGETGPRARPMDPDWVRSLRDQAEYNGIPFWFKDWGTHLKNRFKKISLFHHHGVSLWDLPRKLDGRDWNELPGGNL